MAFKHEFPSRVIWTGNTGTGTSAYKAYERTWDLAIDGKKTVHCSNDPMLGGDPSKYNPEDLLITALSSCHMLWYLHLCSVGGITVTAYEDNPVGIGESEPDGSGRFLKAILRPKIIITEDSDREKALGLHDEIHKYCFIARSVSFPVEYEVSINT
ncbi:MAG: OsmC family protein [Pseudomonadota bacterium]